MCIRDSGGPCWRLPFFFWASRRPLVATARAASEEQVRMDPGRVVGTHEVAKRPGSPVALPNHVLRTFCGLHD
eukprot:3095290-Pyramimonas_sp.AAC.1